MIGRLAPEPAARIFSVQTSRSQFVVIFDGDDTLWRTMPLYTEAKRRFFTLVSRLVPTAQDIETEFEDRDHRNVARWGFTVERFRNSMVETYRELVFRAGGTPQLSRETQISNLATSVIHRKVSPMPFARRTAETIASRARLILLSKGEYDLQKRRVSESGLTDLFERVVIVDHKDADTFRGVVSELRVPAQSVWSVGDSLRSDIQPALAAGLGAVWIPQKTWSYEEHKKRPGRGHRFYEAKSLRALPKVLESAWKVGL
jgi:putative hydrolase of the HAD superfamily